MPFIDNLHSLEYDIARALRSMQTGGRLKVVGAATGHGEADLADAAKRARHPLHGLAKRLTDSYELRTVDLHAGVPEDIDVLLILGSRQTWPDAHLYAVDQHVARGGSLGLFSLQAIPNMQTRQVGPAPVDFARLTAGWGLSISPEIIVDRDLNGAIRLPVTLKTALGLVQGQQQVNSALVPLANILDQEHAITRRLSSLAVPFASPLDSTAALANEALSVTHLASTGPTSRVGASFLSLEPKYLSKASDAERHGPFPVLVSVQGPLDSNWKGQPAPAGVAALGDPSLVAGDLGQQRAPDGTRILVGSSFEMPIANPGLLIAAIDWLAADETLLAIRPRLSPPPFLDFPDDFPTERVKQANVLGIPLLVLLVSGIRLHRRWRGGVTSQSDSSAVDSR